MTFADLLRALARRWPIVLLGVVASVGLAFLATRAEPVYTARAEMVFLAPSSARYPNELITSSESVIITAGIVAKRINGADAKLKYGSPFVNQVGAPDDGEHTWIQLLDTGTQWASAFDDQLLVITTVGATPDEVRERVRAAADLVKSELKAAQDEKAVDPINEITARLSPAEPVITEIDGSGARAAGMTLVLGLLATATVVVVFEVLPSGTERSRGASARAPRSRRATSEPRRL